MATNLNAIEKPIHEKLLINVRKVSFSFAPVLPPASPVQKQIAKTKCHVTLTKNQNNF